MLKPVPSGPREVPFTYSSRGSRLSTIDTLLMGVLPMLR